MGVYRNEKGEWQVSKEVSGVYWTGSLEEKEGFLGATHYEPNLNNIYSGLGIKPGPWEDSSGNKYFGLQINIPDYIFDKEDCFTEDSTFVNQTTYYDSSRNKKQPNWGHYDTGVTPTLIYSGGPQEIPKP